MVCFKKLKDKEALFNVAYLKQDNISSVELLLGHNNTLNDFKNAKMKFIIFLHPEHFKLL